MLRDVTIEDPSQDTRTHKVFRALKNACLQFDLAEPIWFDQNINEFKSSSRTRFHRDNFIEEVDFDYLEIRILEED